MQPANSPKIWEFREECGTSSSGESWPIWGVSSCNYQDRVTYKAERSSNRKRSMMDFLRIVIAILLPPLGVFLQVGIGKQFWINVLLTILGYIPGIVHAVWVIAKY
jgi:uncharacterized membrane protein YqaE (UPF0057 family)